MGRSAPVASPVAQQNRILGRLVRILAVLLLVAAAALVALYLIDQHTDPGPSLVDRQVVAAEEAVRQNPEAVGMRLQLAAAYAADGRPSDATSQYDQVLRESPDNVTALLGEARILEAAQQPAGAAALYQRVIDIRKDGEYAAADNDLEHAYYALGAIEVGQGRYAEAAAALESAVAIDDTDADAWYSLGVARLQAGSPAAAVVAERRAVGFVPLDWADPYTALGQAYTALGETALADWAHAMTDLVAKRYTTARQELEPLVGGPAAEDADVSLGFLAELEGDSATALRWYREALALNPQDANAQSGAARLGGDTPAPGTPSAGAPAGPVGPAASPTGGA